MLAMTPESSVEFTSTGQALPILENTIGVRAIKGCEDKIYCNVSLKEGRKCQAEGRPNPGLTSGGALTRPSFCATMPQQT
jgi:hypothetical protein